MITTTITCDVCGAVKKESNHWYTYGTNGYVFSIQNLVGNPQDSSFHLCGEACATKALSQWARSIQTT